MTQLIRASLPTYDVLTDTNPDHYSLYTDGTTDHILIKEFTRAAVTFNSTDYPSGYTVAHNLGYVPMFLAFVNGGEFFGAPAGWQQVGNGNLSIAYAAAVDTTNLTLYTGGGNTDFIYYIFYDNQVGSSSATISESNQVLKVSKIGVNAETSIDPNNYIFHSDLNTFKILKEGTSTISYTANGTYSFNHGVSLTNPTGFMAFYKFPDDSISMSNGTFASPSRNKVWSASPCITTSQIKSNVYGDGTSQNIEVKYYIFETPLTGSSGVTITPSDHLIRITKSGYDALTETDPNNYVFLSGFNTLKYYSNGSRTVTANGSGSGVYTETIAHNLGYAPFFIAYVDFAMGYNVVPYITSTLPLGNRQSSVYVDDTNIYFEINITEFPGFPITYNFSKTFYYKIFKNNLGL